MPTEAASSASVHLVPVPAAPLIDGDPTVPRSATEIGFLEWLRPGAGLRSVGRIRLGRYVRVGTLAGTLVLVLVLQWYAGFFRAFGLSFVPAPPSPPPGPRDILAVFLVLLGLELVWLMVRIVWASRLAVRLGPARRRSARVLTQEEVAAAVRTLRVIALVALVPFALVAILFLMTPMVPGSGPSFAAVIPPALILGGSVAFVAALIGVRDMVRVRGGAWRTVGIVLMLLNLLLDALLAPFLVWSPTDLSQVDPIRALLPATVPLLTLAYAVFSLRQRQLIQPTHG